MFSSPNLLDGLIIRPDLNVFRVPWWGLGVLWGVYTTCLSSVVTVLVCSIDVWCVITPTVKSQMNSREATGRSVDTSGFIIAADLSFLGCFWFLRSNFLDGVCTLYDLGSMCLTVFGINGLLFFLLVSDFTGRFPMSFRLNTSSPGEGIVWLMGVAHRHSNTMSKSWLLEVAFLIAAFMACTQHSARPFDWGYLGDDVQCSNLHSLANCLKRVEL